MKKEINIVRRVFLGEYGKILLKTKPQVVICDSAVMIHSLRQCMKIPYIVIPNIEYNTIEKVARGKFVDDENTKDELASCRLARKTLKYMSNNQSQIKIIPRLAEESFFVNPTEDVKTTALAVVALACDYAKRGYNVLVKTRMAEIYKLAKLQEQEAIEVEFLERD